MKKITRKTKFNEIMEINSNAGKILFEYGLHCVGCGLASIETLEQGCKAHGMKKKEIDELIEKLNKKNIKKKSKKKKIKKDEKNKKIKKLPKEKKTINELKRMVE